MRTRRIGPEAVAARNTPCVLAVGAFDGVHIGHQRLLSRTATEAARLGLPPAVLTFDPLPLTALRRASGRVQLSTLDERLSLIETLGVHLAYIMSFDRALAAVPAQEFAANVLRDALRTRLLVVGHSHTFGAGAKGNPDLLRSLARCFGYDVVVVEGVTVGGQVVTSTGIRALLTQGRVSQAARGLGRPYRLEGSVVPGRGRGTELGFPTLNLEPPEPKVLPAPGVYACVAGWQGRWHPAAVYVGCRPTFERAECLQVEANVIGEVIRRAPKRMALDFVERLRGDKKWPRVDHLVRQMERDVARAIGVLQARGIVGPALKQPRIAKEVT